MHTAQRPSDAPNASIDYQAFVARSADVNIVSKPDGVYLYVSPGCHQLFGWTPNDLEGKLEDDFVHPDDRTVIRTARADLSESDFVTTTHRHLCHDGSYRWIEAISRLVEIDGWALIVSSLRDITARRHHEALLQLQARSDPLTGVANRTVLMDRLNQGLRRMGRARGGLALLYLDLDRFRVINDSLGHRVGDQLLTDVARRLVTYLRPSDTLARLGGDEFVIVAESMSNEQSALELADRIISTGHEAFRVDGQEFQCTLSVGIAWTADAERAGEELLRDADLALYKAKDLGRDRAEVFREDLRTTAFSRLVTEQMLRQALDEGRVVVEYQPIIDLQTARPVAAEALLRIHDPELGLLHPQSFLDVAEEIGLLAEIDELVLKDAVKQSGTWRTSFTDSEFSEVAINVTARHLADAQFAQGVVATLDAAGIPHHHLQIELSERTLIEASGSALASLRALRNAGMKVGLDDFGTGYSSLAYLRQFPLDFVKIDRHFIQDLDRHPGEKAIVAAIIGLCHALELTVVAEGVETRNQLRILQDLRCDRAQGFLFAASSSPASIAEWAAARPDRPSPDLAMSEGPGSSPPR
jgi:diguanylate cyclase (GGDEF)-like protein/PAS domain S-box-containing protein